MELQGRDKSLMKSFVVVSILQYTCVTDGRTDRQTDRQTDRLTDEG